MHYSNFEVKEILTVGHGKADSRDMVICAEAYDYRGQQYELAIHIDRVEFLRWFDKDTMNELKELAIQNLKQL
jgi:hypothetical protein